MKDETKRTSDKARQTLRLLNKRSSKTRYWTGDDLEGESKELQLAVARIGATDPDAGVRHQAADALGLIGTSLDGYRLIQLLKDRDWMVRSTATEAVERILGKRGQKVLLPMLNDPHPIVRRDAAVMLGYLGHESSIAFLQNRLRIEKTGQAELGLREALFTLGERQHLQALVNLFERDDGWLCDAVWGTVAELLELGPMSSEELDIVCNGMDTTRRKYLTHSLIPSLNKLGERFKELYPAFWAARSAQSRFDVQLPTMLFKTARLVIRRLTKDDVPAMHTIYGDSETMKSYGEATPLSEEACSEWVEIIDANFERRGYGLVAFVEALTNEIIGCGGLVHYGQKLEPMIKYAFRRDRWGNGFATEAVSALLRHAREVWSVGRVMATVAPENVPSQRVLSKAGFTYILDRANRDGTVTQIWES